jgi:RNase H-like domain found in reverse transcriptase
MKSLSVAVHVVFKFSHGAAAARAAVSAATLLAHPSPAADLVLVTDASGSHVGAVLQQRCTGQAWRPLGFFSQKLSPAESRYSAFDRELLAVFSSILHFKHLLEGRHFSVFSDHKPLAGALHKVADLKSDRQRRQFSFIAEFVSEIKHIAGAANVVADTLSWPPCSSPSSSPPSCSPPSCSLTFTLSTFMLSTFTLSTFMLSTFTLFAFRPGFASLFRDLRGGGARAGSGSSASFAGGDGSGSSGGSGRLGRRTVQLSRLRQSSYFGFSARGEGLNGRQ